MRDRTLLGLGGPGRWPGRAMRAAVVLALVLVGTSATLQAAPGGTNGSNGGDALDQRRAIGAEETRARIERLTKGTAGGGVSCRILDVDGTAVTQVAAMSFGDPGYWLEFRSSGQLARFVQYTTLPLFDGSPLLGQRQRFDTDFSNVVTTPFGIPDWGVDQTSGPWALVVRDDLGRSASCRFEVVP